MTRNEPPTATFQEVEEITPFDATTRLIEMWVFERSPYTQEAYSRYARKFLEFINKPLHLAALADIQGWQGGTIEYPSAFLIAALTNPWRETSLAR
jgi:hypothetical protein